MIEEELNDDEEAYKIANWVPAWVDNGERLIEFIQGIRYASMDIENKKDFESIWKIGCLFISKQLMEDIKMAKLASEFGLDPHENE